MRILYYSAILVTSIVLLSSCASRKDVIYFQAFERDTIIQSVLSYEPILEADDLLLITVSSIDLEAVAPFNMPMVTNSTFSGNITSAKTMLKYLIKKNGTIDFPVIGEIKIAGKTRQQAKIFLEEKLSLYLKDAIVNINITNFKITILGDVTKAGTYTINQERITLLEAIGMAGDLNITARRNNILVIRELEGELAYTRVDITGDALFTSPVYYLKQNDVIYVEPNKAKINASVNSATTGVIISVTSILISLISLFVK